MSIRKGMLQRCWLHDYRARCIYMVTLTSVNRAPIFGRLAGGEAEPYVALSDAGRMIEACWREIPARFPGVSLFDHQVMPDHFHGIIFVEKRMEKPLGSIIGFLKAHSTSQMGQPLWSPGFQDSILLNDGQFANMRNYIRDNPRRLAVKRAHPEYFRIVRDCQLFGMTFASIGNQFLLDRPIKLQVQCSRSITPEELAAKQSKLLTAAQHGAVLVSPCISPGEKQIARAAREAGLPLIVLLENGFPPLYKPPKNYFDACAEGRLLMLAPWPYHQDRRTITRAQCLALNAWAKQLETGPGTAPQAGPNRTAGRSALATQ